MNSEHCCTFSVFVEYLLEYVVNIVCKFGNKLHSSQIEILYKIS